MKSYAANAYNATGMAWYEWCVGSSPATCDVVPYTRTEVSEGHMYQLVLLDGYHYYTSVVVSHVVYI